MSGQCLLSVRDEAVTQARFRFPTEDDKRTKLSLTNRIG
jgi:hypothetical protein